MSVEKSNGGVPKKPEGGLSPFVHRVVGTDNILGSKDLPLAPDANPRILGAFLRIDGKVNHGDIDIGPYRQKAQYDAVAIQIVQDEQDLPDFFHNEKLTLPYTIKQVAVITDQTTNALEVFHKGTRTAKELEITSKIYEGPILYKEPLPQIVDQYPLDQPLTLTEPFKITNNENEVQEPEQLRIVEKNGGKENGIESYSFTDSDPAVVYKYLEAVQLPSVQFPWIKQYRVDEVQLYQEYSEAGARDGTKFQLADRHEKLVNGMFKSTDEALTKGKEELINRQAQLDMEIKQLEQAESNPNLSTNPDVIEREE